jgi:lysine-N-methylase
LPPTPPIRTAYAESFRCIGAECEDTCCEGWNVPIDQATYEKYQQLAPSPLRTLINDNILMMPEGAKPATFAMIQINGANPCPLLSADRMCRIQTELGESFLSHTCAIYPRLAQTIGGIEEMALSLSCPEAARLVLLTPGLLTQADLQPDSALAGASAGKGAAMLLGWFWPIRKAVLALVRNRSYPLWQRLFLLGVFCRRLDTIASGELKRSVPEFLGGFQASIATGTLRTAMETLPLDRSAQLDVVLRLAGMLLHRSSIRPRFIACVEAFTKGIGNGPGATLESLTGHYAQAHDRYYAPFFSRHPQILENYLINTILRCRFPFGQEGAPAEAQFSLAREYALLTAQFALMKGFLIGAAGSHREAFSAAHAVHTVQAISKHFDHHPEFLDLAYQLLAESQMNGARGLAILLRNTEPKAPRPAVPGIHAPQPREERGTPQPF